MEYFKVGKIVAVHGLKGELLLKHTLGKKTSLKGLRAIFIEEKKNVFLPWFIETTRIKTADELYLKLENVDSREKAIPLTQKEIWLPENDFQKYVSKSSPITLLGYTVMNDGQPLGEILELIEQPHQMIARLEINSKEVLVPLNEAFISKIDHRNKKVMVTLPDGLLDVYM